MIRVLIYASHPIVRAGLESIVRSQSVFEFTGSSSNLNELIQAEYELQPDVILIDWLETDEEAFWEPLLAAESSDLALVVLTDRKEGNFFLMGVRGILPRSATETEIVTTITSVAAGLIVLHPNCGESCLNIHSFRAQILPSEPVETLTPREIEVLQLLALGLGVAD